MVALTVMWLHDSGIEWSKRARSFCELVLIESGYASKPTFIVQKLVNPIIYIPVLFGNNDNLLVEEMKHFTRFIFPTDFFL